ncbi:ras-related protein RABA6b [Senna tora]|uniref:Ras-related protein RABA6b n=1 Tax=Senna tora TaxID=362788 RepID=A0A834TJR7_9FABA|nr:ras-related protein RABA6b [Senna tora]
MGALLVYDITRRATFESVRKWLRELREYGNQDMVVILVGNKCDLKESRQVEEEEGRVVAEEEGLCFMETSALQNLNVEEAFLEMITKIHDVTIHKSLEAKRNDTLSMMMNLSNGKEISLDDEGNLKILIGNMYTVTGFALQYLSVATSQDLISLSSKSLVFGVYAAADKFFDTVSGDLGLDLCLRS